MSSKKLTRIYLEITTIADDLDHYCEAWGENANKTVAQQQVWDKKKITHTQLGKDDEKTLRLPVEDGLDGETVGSLGKHAARKFFYFEDRLFPPDRDLVRFGLFFHLGFFRTLQLVVKNQWEIYLCDLKKIDYISSVKEHDDNELMRNLNSFKLGLNKRSDGGALFDLFEEHGKIASSLGYDQDKFNLLTGQMIKSKVLYCANSGPELQKFIILQQEELSLLKEASREQEREFWLKKCCWLEIQNELGDKLTMREDVRLKNFNLNLRWLSLFGAIYQTLLENQMQLRQLERRLEIKMAAPEMPEGEIDKLVAESMKKELAELEQLKEQAMMASLLGIMGPNGAPVSGPELENYQKEMKKILREIHRRTHPDGMSLHMKFTEHQREQLRGFFEQSMKIQYSEAGLDVRSIPALKHILAKVIEIYETVGIDLEPNSVIRGSTLEEQLTWLENEIQRMERELSDLRAEITAMAMNPDIREKQASMATDETQKETTAILEQKKKECEERLIVLEDEYRALMAEGDKS